MHLDKFVPKLLVQGLNTRSSHMRKLTFYVCIRGETIIPGDPGVIKDVETVHKCLLA